MHLGNLESKDIRRAPGPDNVLKPVDSKKKIHMLMKKWESSTDFKYLFEFEEYRKL